MTAAALGASLQQLSCLLEGHCDLGRHVTIVRSVLQLSTQTSTEQLCAALSDLCGKWAQRNNEPEAVIATELITRQSRVSVRKPVAPHAWCAWHP